MTDPQIHPLNDSYRVEGAPGWGPAMPPGASSGWTPSACPETDESEPSGIIPLRPLTIADIFSGTLNAIRANPLLHLGLTACVMALVGAAAGIQVAGLSRALRLVERAFVVSTGADPLWGLRGVLIPSLSFSALALVLSVLASVLLTGMLSLAVADSVVGRRPTARETWKRLRPRFAPLLGTTLLISMLSVAFIAVMTAVILMIVFGLLALVPEMESSLFIWVIMLVLMCLIVIVVTFAALVALTVRLVFAPIVCVLEERGPVESISRSWALTGGAFGRLLGRYLLMVLVVNTLVGVVVGAFTGVTTTVMMLLNSPVFDGAATGLTVMLAGIAVPVQVACAVLMYTDERMRTEGLAPALAAARASAAAGSPMGS